MKKQRDNKENYIGGQAVIEGVMMRGKKAYTLAVRNPAKGIDVAVKEIGERKGLFFLKLPVIRGIRAFVESLTVGMKVIYDSAEMAGLDELEEENPSRLDKFLEEKFGDKLFEYLMMLSVVLAVALGIGLFMALPAFLSGFITPFLGGRTWAIGIIEGLVRIAIFLVYIALVSRTKDIRRVFGYHGAEHKTINCYESGDPLSTENVRKHSRLHKRCGTSFLLIVMLVSMVVFFFIRTETVWMRVVSRVALVPLIAGLSYEIIRWAGRHDNFVVGLVSYPGMCLQKITTNEPDDAQIEVAIAAMNKVLEVEGLL